MDQTLSTLHISIFTTVLMLIIHALIYFHEKERRHLHTLEFWLSYFVYFVVSYITQTYGPGIVALSTLVWIWRTSATGKILSDVAGVSLLKGWHTLVIIAAYMFGLLLYFAGVNFTFFTIPMAIANFIIGVSFIVETYKSKKFQEDKTITHKLLLLTVSIIFIHILDYPFFRYTNDLAGIGFSIVLLTTILMAVILPAVSIFDLQKENQKNLELLLQERMNQLKAQSKLSALGEMTAGIAHEINNPLGIILHRANFMRNQIMKDNLEKDYLVRNLDQIEATSEQMTKIIKSLKNFSRDSKNEPLAEISVKQIVEETLSYCRDRFRMKAIEILVDPYPESTIECRSIQISQVLLNLLNNSFDAVVAQADPWIHISFSTHENFFQMIVTDSGKGIPDAIRPKIMEPFFTTKASFGTGLGLSISKGIVEDHHGRLYYDESSKNTTFVVELPYKQSSP